jgi:hypothetical protein
MEEVKCKKCGSPVVWDPCDDCDACPLSEGHWTGTPFCTVSGKENPKGGCSITICKTCHTIGERMIKNDN